MLKRSFRGTHGFAITFLLLALGCASQERPRAIPSRTPRARLPSRPSSRRSGEVEAGNELMARGQYDEAERSFRLALESDPASLEATAGLGRVAVQRGALSRRPCAPRARDQGFEPDRARVPGLGDAYAATQPDRAAAAYRHPWPWRPEAWIRRLSLARSAAEVGEYEEAEGSASGR